MALVHTGILGPISGKVGNMVFYTVRGKCFVKSMPRPSLKSPSAKQIIQRSKFGLAGKFISPVASVLNDCNRCIRKKTAGDAALSQILGEAITGSYPHLGIDYSKVELLRGNLAYPHGKILACSSPDQLVLCWMRPQEYNSNPDDELQIMIYCPDKTRWYIPNNQIRRKDMACLVHLPSTFKDQEIHVWIAFRHSNHRSCSSSQYLGKVKYRTSVYVNN